MFPQDSYLVFIIFIAAPSLPVINPHEVNGNSFLSKPACPADSMQICLWVSRKVVIDDKIDLSHVDASAEDICGYEQLWSFLLEEIIVKNSLFLLQGRIHAEWIIEVLL